MPEKKTRIWIGVYRLGRRTVYAKTAAATRSECVHLIQQGPFYNTDPVRATLTFTLPKRRPKRGIC